MGSLVTSKNVSWPRLIWPTLYTRNFKIEILLILFYNFTAASSKKLFDKEPVVPKYCHRERIFLQCCSETLSRVSIKKIDY